MSRQYPIFVKRDLDGFFGLFIDNIVQLLLIIALCTALCGMTGDGARFVYERILPGAAVSILIGNLFYAWQAHRLAAREGRSDVTALPYGINTPSLLVYVFFVMAPVYRQTGSAKLAWQMGLVACLGSGLIEFIGAFVAEAVRRSTPRAALLATLAGIAIGFISMTFALQIWHKPIVAMLPWAVIMVTYFAMARMPLGLPGGLVAILLGSLIAWILPGDWTGRPMSAAAVADAWNARGLYLPVWCGPEIFEALRLPAGEWLKHLAVIIPMGLFNVAGSLQNIESAEAGGDAFNTRSAMAINGLGSIAAALFGSCFPTTIYIGHPGWKRMGARAGYSTLNGLVITAVCLSGTVALLNSVIPIEAGIAIVLWIGIIITAQAFQVTPSAHAPAVALGLFPAIAAWGATVMAGAFDAARLVRTDGGLIPTGPGNTMQHLLNLDHPQAGLDTLVNGFLVHGMNLMERGYIFTCMILAAIAACLIDQRFRAAAAWGMIGALCAALGLTHAYQIIDNQIDHLFIFAQPVPQASGYRAWSIAAGYLLSAGLFFAFSHRRFGGDQRAAPVEDAARMS